MSQPLVEIRSVSVDYPLKGGRVLHALTRVSLAVAAGETVGLVGESGSGKSTLGRVILGMTRPMSGQVIFGRRGHHVGEPRSSPGAGA